MTAIIGFESSCDETAVAVVVDGRKVLSNAIASQIAKPAVYGGVVPELAAREHLTAIRRVTDESLKEAGVTMDQIDAVAVTNGPGLVPALLVGVNFAKGFAAAYKKPLIGINHFLGHIYGVFLDQEEDIFAKKELFPMVGLVVSGGHTSLVLIKEDGTANVIGTTLDDAAGEAFDKAAKMLNLGYPGGPVIEKAARNGDAHRFSFPRSLTGTAGKALAPENRFNFSFSGVKTALLYHAKKHVFRRSGFEMFPQITVAGDASAENQTFRMEETRGIECLFAKHPDDGVLIGCERVVKIPGSPAAITGQVNSPICRLTHMPAFHGNSRFRFRHKDSRA